MLIETLDIRPAYRLLPRCDRSGEGSSSLLLQHRSRPSRLRGPRERKIEPSLRAGYDTRFVKPIDAQ